MLNSNMLLCLYTRVLEETSFLNGVSEGDIKQAIENMHKDYKGSPDSLNVTLDGLTDFNEIAHRCAYLFKYAPFHTALTYKALSHALSESSFELQALVDSLTGPLKICSLGGGPGADAIGVIAALHTQFGFFRSYVKLVDIMSEWELTFCSVLDELRGQNYGSLSESMSEKWFDWSFMRADLQSKMSRELKEILATADVVTMIKFVSAAACKETSSMIEKVFRTMKPGAFLLFVDNAGGGFKELISNAAQKYKFISVSTPLKHQPYINECFNNIKYGYRSCYESKVAVQFLMKSGLSYCSNEGNLIRNKSYKKNLPSSPVTHWQKIYVPPIQNFSFGPKLAHNLMDEHETFESPPSLNWHDSNFSPSSEFSPRLNRFKEQIHSPVNLNESFESQPFWSSTPHALSSQSRPMRDESQIYDAGYEDESIGNDPSLSAHCSNEIDLSCIDNFVPSPPSFWQKMHVPKLQNVRIRSKLVDNLAHDSGYSDESFESELSWNSPVCNSSQHFRGLQRLGKQRIPIRKTSHSFSENAMLMPYDENSGAPLSYREDLRQLKQSSRIPFKRIDDSMYNQSPLISESPLHRSKSSNRQPFGVLQTFERYWCEPERLGIRQSENGLLPFPSPHQQPGKYKAPKRSRKVLMPRHKPY